MTGRGSALARSFSAYQKMRAPSFLTFFGPRGVRALPLAAGINVGGHYKWHIFSPKNRGPPQPPALCNLWGEKGGILKIYPRVPKHEI